MKTWVSAFSGIVKGADDFEQTISQSKKQLEEQSLKTLRLDFHLGPDYPLVSLM